MECFKGNSSRENQIRLALALLWWALEKEHPHVLGSWVLSYMVFLSQFFPRSNHLSSTNNHTLVFKRLGFSYCRMLAIRVAVQSQGLGINNKLFSNAFLWKKESIDKTVTGLEGVCAWACGTGTQPSRSGPIDLARGSICSSSKVTCPSNAGVAAQESQAERLWLELFI